MSAAEERYITLRGTYAGTPRTLAREIANDLIDEVDLEPWSEEDAEAFVDALVHWLT